MRRMAQAMVSQAWRLRYAGAWYDQELGWYWMTTRVCDPVLERFLQPDPGQQEGIFTYAYGMSNPVDYEDTSGMCPVNLVDGFCPAGARGTDLANQPVVAPQAPGPATAAEIAYSIGSQATIAVSLLPTDSGSQSYVSNGNTWVYTTRPQSYTSASPSGVPQTGNYYAIDPKSNTIVNTGVSVAYGRVRPTIVVGLGPAR